MISRKETGLTIMERSGQIYSVSELTRELKQLLENTYPFVWITGEISNFTIPSSGHVYFSLKDHSAVIQCVMFRNQRKRLRFSPENGMTIMGMGRISLYEPRGSYQLIFEHMEPEGTGALQAAFEQLKIKLNAEGLFNSEFKQPIPFLPKRLSVITSPTGSVIRDIISVARRRFPTIGIEIVPVKVQGDGAEQQIVAALKDLNQRSSTEVIILARGGGSLEDLMAFNSEQVARAVFDSDVPVISAIGHETDFSITDFVADLRAPTPSAAAELAVPDRSALIRTLGQLTAALQTAITGKVSGIKNRVLDLQARLKSPQRIIDDMRFRLEELDSRMIMQVTKMVQHQHQKLDWYTDALYSHNPGKQCRHLRRETLDMIRRMITGMTARVVHLRSEHEEKASLLAALNPMSVLERGYSIARTSPGGVVITDAGAIRQGNLLEVILKKGTLLCRVEKTNGEKENL